MNEWRQTTIVVCTIIVGAIAFATLMHFDHTAFRADMRAGHAALRADMRAGHAALREEMGADHASMRAGHAEIRALLSSIDRRIARIEGHLFGIEIPQDTENGE